LKRADDKRNQPQGAEVISGGVKSIEKGAWEAFVGIFEKRV
jgi:hypothetical protein